MVGLNHADGGGGLNEVTIQWDGNPAPMYTGGVPFNQAFAIYIDGTPRNILSMIWPIEPYLLITCVGPLGTSSLKVTFIEEHANLRNTAGILAIPQQQMELDLT